MTAGRDYRPEVVVVGAGIAGAATALELKDRGAFVTAVDACQPGSGATGASAGMLAPQYEVPEPGPVFDVAIEARRFWPGFADRLSNLSGRRLKVSRTGLLLANRTADERSRSVEIEEWHREEGLRAEVIGRSEAETLGRNARLRAPSYLWLPDEGAVDAQRLPDVLSESLRSAGVRLVTGKRVAAVDSRSGSVTAVVLADGRRLSADVVVLAAGAWSGDVDGLPRSLDLRPVKGQLLRYQLESSSPRRIVAIHEGAYLVPRGEGTVLAGSTMEESGYDRSISDEARRSITDRLHSATSLLDGRDPREQWAGLRPVSGDGRPVLGQDPDLDGLTYATGYGRNGILLAPLCGRMVANLVMDKEPQDTLAPFRPERFSGGGG